MLLSSSVCNDIRNVTQIADNYMKYVNVAEDEKCYACCYFKCLWCNEKCDSNC